MINFRTIILGICLTLILVPLASNVGAETQVVWPQSDYMNRDAVSNLTSWFAEQLGVHMNGSEDGEWTALNESQLPYFLLAKEAYVLPLIDGEIEAQYTSSGILRNIELRGNTSYTANSVGEEDLGEVAVRIASDLGLSSNRSQIGTTFVVLYPGTPYEEFQWLITLEGATGIGNPFFINNMLVTVRETDLHVISVKLFAWYDQQGSPEFSDSDAVALASEFARSRYNATDPYCIFQAVTVINGTSFVYLVHVDWEEDIYSSWTLDVWVDSSSGEILDHMGPEMITEDTVLRGPEGFWVPFAILVVIAVFIGFVIFYRLSAERALDHFNRGRIYGFIQANPGIKYTDIRKELALKNGTLSYHLWVLERLDLVRSERTGRCRLLYPRDVSYSSDSMILSRLQYAIIDLLHAEGPLSQTDIANHLKISRQRVHYNVKMLLSFYLVQSTMDGRIELSQKGTEKIVEIEGRHLTDQGSKTPTHG